MDDLVAMLREENERLSERVRQLEALLLPEDISIPLEWGLVNAERRCFAALTKREIVTKEILYQALYGDRLDLDKEPEISVVESHMSKLRKKLRPFGVVIIARRFEGYSLMNRDRYGRTPPVPLKTGAVNG